MDLKEKILRKLFLQVVDVCKLLDIQIFMFVYDEKKDSQTDYSSIKSLDFDKVMNLK